jgi:transcription elongation factor Elf1
MELKPTPRSNDCPHCGREGLTLCIDVVQYREVYFKDGEWSASPVRHQEPIWSEQGARLMCSDCGEYFHVPETLQGE